MRGRPPATSFCRHWARCRQCSSAGFSDLQCFTFACRATQSAYGPTRHPIAASLGIFVIYGTFSVLGWIFVGVPIAVAFPVRLLSRLAWPGRIVMGAALGPLALVLIFVVLFTIQSRRSAFSLAHTESLWPFSILVSSISFLVYAALLRRRY